MAKIKWLDYKKGGRKKFPPKGTRYCPIVKFENYNDSVWSADFVCESIDENYESVVEFGFLSPEAPVYLLRKTQKFELFEGDKKVAFGILL